MPISNDIEKILELARWAPSGDNTQCWRFEIINDRTFVIHGFDTSDWCVYDLNGHASHLAIGALMENIVLAAAKDGIRADFNRRQDVPETQPTIDVTLVENSNVTYDPLVDFIEHRVTQRRPLSTRPLTSMQKQRLEQSTGPGYRVTWIESAVKRWQIARLLARSAKIRLTIPEAYEAHRQLVEWNTQYSADRVPDQAIGLNPVGLKLMQWAMKNWKRVDFLNKYLCGTWLPRLQLDLLPGFFCGAHFMISSTEPPQNVDDYLSVGRAMQRFWLTATQQGLQFQPEMTPLIFSHYSQRKQTFTRDRQNSDSASILAADLERGFNVGISNSVFMGRIGLGPEPKARSNRLEVGKLIKEGNCS